MPIRLLRIQVRPKACAALLAEGPDGIWKASLRAPPADDKANAELMALLAERFGHPGNLRFPSDPARQCGSN